MESRETICNLGSPREALVDSRPCFAVETRAFHFNNPWRMSFLFPSAIKWPFWRYCLSEDLKFFERPSQQRLPKPVLFLSCLNEPNCLALTGPPTCLGCARGRYPRFRTITTQSSSLSAGGSPSPTVAPPLTEISDPVCNSPPSRGLNQSTRYSPLESDKSSDVVPPSGK